MLVTWRYCNSSDEFLGAAYEGIKGKYTLYKSKTAVRTYRKWIYSGE